MLKEIKKESDTESYDVWKSENANLGNTTVVVK